MKLFFQEKMVDLVTDNSLSDQNKPKNFKYKVRSFSVAYVLAQNSRQLQKGLQQKITTFEQNLSTKENLNEYMNTKKEFNKLHDKIADGVKIHSKCNWYQHEEKYTSFFLNLEKKRTIGGTIKNY